MAQESVNQEIKWLEEQLEAKKREFGSSGKAREEHEVARDIFKEVSQQQPPSFPVTTTSLTDDTAQKAAHELEEKQHHEIIEGLIQTALSKGIANAVKITNNLKNPHLLDDFHDALADQYYEKLLESRKIKSE